MLNRPRHILFRHNERGFALLMVVLILMGLLIIAVPFAVSMRFAGSRAQTALARAHARFAAEGACNHAIASLLRTQEQCDVFPFQPPQSVNSTFFEPHTLDTPAELEVAFGNEDDPDLDLTGELPFRNPRGTIWSVEVEDEQGKINLNSASFALLRNLLYLMGAAVEGHEPLAAAEAAANRLLDYRRAKGGFHAVSEAAWLLTDGDGAPFTPARLINLPRYATVSSERPNPGAPHPVNINTAPELVLAAIMMNLRLNRVAASPNAGNQGNGSLSPITVRSSAEEGDWKVELGDDGAVGLSFRGIGASGYGTATAVSPSTENGEIEHQGIVFTVYPGTIPFGSHDEIDRQQECDKFYFSTRKITEDMARALARAMQHEVEMVAGGELLPGKQGFTIVDNDSIAMLGKEGHLEVDTQVLYYMKRNPSDENGDYLLCNYATAFPTGEAVCARRVIASLNELGSLYFLIESLLPDSPNTTANALDSALKLNAFRPWANELENGTTSFCFTTSDTYTITGRGSANNDAGNELAVRGVRKTISIKRPIPVVDGGSRNEGTWTMDTESGFAPIIESNGHSIYASSRSVEETRATALPANHRTVFPSVSLRPRKAWHLAPYGLHMLNFGGNLAVLSNLTLTNSIPPLTKVPYGDALLSQATNTSCTYDEGPTFTIAGNYNSRPRLAYSTHHAPIPMPGDTCKAIEMWVKPDDWSDNTRDYFLFDVTRPYHRKSVADWAEVDEVTKRIELMRTPFENRIAIFYDGAKRELVFRIADAARATISGEVRKPFDPPLGTWHHIRAVWSGMKYGEMMLLVDGRADGNYYSPKWTWNRFSGIFGGIIGRDSRNRPVIVGNQIFDPRDTSEPIRSTGGEGFDPPESDDVATVYGYSARFDKLHYESDPEDRTAGVDYDNLGSYGGKTLASELALAAQTIVIAPMGLPADATEIPVESTADFQDKGFLLIGSEILYYDSKTEAAFEGLGRGIGIYSGGFGTSESVGSTGIAREAQPIDDRAAVVPISIHVTDNRSYPTPRYFSPASDEIGTAAGYFGIRNEGKNYVRIEDEFIGYTHKPGTEFLVDLSIVDPSLVSGPDSGRMRGQLGSQVSVHTMDDNNNLPPLIPVYRVDYAGQRGGPGPGDRVTILDDNLLPTKTEVEIHSTGDNRRYVSFSAPIGAAWLSRNARIVKFPCDEFNLGPFFSIGTNTGPKARPAEGDANPYKMDLPAEATIDEVKICGSESTITVARLAGDGLPASGDRAFILHPYFWDPDFNIGLNGSAVQAWPAQGYALVDDEIIYYRTAFRHNVVELERGAGAICAPSNSVYVNATIGAGDNSIQWTAGEQGGASPEDAGFNPDGGYLTILSEVKHDDPSVPYSFSDATREYLIDAGFLTPEDFPEENYDAENGIWKFAHEGGVWYGQRQEVVKYTGLSNGRFTGLTRGLFGTAPAEHAPVDNEEGDRQRYPRLIANTCELQVLQRGCLGTAAARHPAGSRIMPLYHVITSFMTKPLRTGDDRLYVESHANFPYRGYLAVSDREHQEIIGYTGKSQDDDGQCFTGVRYFRRRFGTPRVALDFLETSDLDELNPADDHSLKGVVRLYEARYDDRLPLRDADLGEPVFQVNDANLHGSPAYLEITRTIRGARWGSIKWVEGPTGTWDDPAPNRGDYDTDPDVGTGTEVFVLWRIDGEPDWSELTLLTNAFTDPADENRIDAVGDTLELRIYFRYNEHYANDAGAIKQWVSPMLRALKIGYTAPSSVYQQEEVRF